MVHRKCFDPSDLEAIELAFEAVVCAVEIDAGRRNHSHDELLKAQIRQKLFQLAELGKINPQELCERVLLIVLKDEGLPRNGAQP